LTLTPGPVIDYAYVKRAVLSAAEAFDLRCVEYDRWNSSQLVQELADEGVSMFAVGQGVASMTAPTKELQRLVADGSLRHGGDPLLRWCASNFAVWTDPAANVKPDKARSSHRIDPIVGLVTAVDGWQRFGQGQPRASVYEDRFHSGVAAGRVSRFLPSRDGQPPRSGGESIYEDRFATAAPDEADGWATTAETNPSPALSCSSRVGSGGLVGVHSTSS
jgi:hypothetical protein